MCKSRARRTSISTIAAADPPSVIESKGSVSPDVALSLAEGVRKLTGAKLGIGVTGVAGPGGGSPEKPVGLVYVGMADERGSRQKDFRFLGDRERIRLFASQAALDMTRRYFLVPSGRS